MILMYRNRGWVSTNLTEAQVFDEVAKYGIKERYFVNHSGTGNMFIFGYMSGAFKLFGRNIDANTWPIQCDYSSIKTALNDNALIYVGTQNNEYYGDHAVVCFAYTRMKNATGAYKTFLKIADGRTSNQARYMDLATLTPSAGGIAPPAFLAVK